MHSGNADTTCNITSQNYPTQKIAEKQIETQRRSFDPPHHLKSRVPPPLPEVHSANQNSLPTGQPLPCSFQPGQQEYTALYACRVADL